MQNQSLHFEDALNFLIERLSKVPEPGQGRAMTRFQQTHGSDVWIDDVSANYWASRGKQTAGLSQDEKEPLVAAFYDAAWTLCRRGILRPAAAVPDGQLGAQMGQRAPAAPFYGDGYSLTAWGSQWLKKTASERVVLSSDPSRVTAVLHQLKPQFGNGYAQRAAEAVSDWWTANYLSACTMAGAAAESILLAVAIAKVKDEKKVLSQYQSSSGRSRVLDRVVGNVPLEIANRFKNALGILSYWRDDAGHGMASNIGEIEAHEAISRLLRLAQFTSDYWDVLIA